MQRFSIKDIENLTGIKAHTFRIWEQRYPFFQPKRKESKHRFYENDDLKILLQVAFLYHHGWKISKISTLSSAEMERIVREFDVVPQDYKAYVFKLIEAALDFNENVFRDLLIEVIEKIGFERCITEVCFPYLIKIGLLWSTNNVIPAQEHFSSYLIQNRIISETEKLHVSSPQPDIILFCPQQEFHELPLLFLNYLLKKNKRGTIYLGTNITLQELETVASLRGINQIYLHLITNFTGFSLEDYYEELCTRFRDKKIIASGMGALPPQRTFTNLRVLRSDREIYDFVRGELII